LNKTSKATPEDNWLVKLLRNEGPRANVGVREEAGFLRGLYLRVVTQRTARQTRHSDRHGLA